MENSTGAGLFTRRVVLLKDSDCVRLDGKILMPTTIDMAKIKKPSTGQYNKNVQFSKSMSEELVRQTLQDAFPLFNLTGRFYCASYGHKSTAFNLHGNPGVWGGNMINKTVRGNSVLYILLEDDQMPQESPHVTNGTAPSSAPVASENVNQPTLSNTSGIVMSQNNLQPWSDNLLHGCTSFLPGPSATSKNVDMMKPQNIAGTVSFQGLNQSTYASDNTSRTITTQYDIPPCSGFQVQESSIPHLGSSAASTNFNVTTSQEITATVALPNLMNQSTLSDASATIMAQRDWQPSNDFPMQEVDQFLPGPSAACANVDMITSQTIAAAADGDPDFTTLMDLWPEEMPGLFDNDETGTSDISNIQPPNQGILLNSLESFDCPADDDGSTSGVCDHNSSSDDLSTHEDEHFNFSVEPNKVPLKGAGCCRFESDRALPENVQSGFASFENLETVEVYRLMDKFLIGMKIPPAQKPGWVKIFLKKADGKALGKTVILYYDEELEALEVVVQSPRLQAHLFRKWADSLENHNTATSNGGEAQNFGICGSRQPVQMLCVLVYTAAEIGGQRFIEMIFNSSAGRVVYDLYKDRSALPEAIARECGHEKKAIYVEEITKRFSKESDAPNYPQTIDWSELVRAAEEAQKQLGLSSEEKSNHLESNVVKDTGYVGDIDTSSNESCESVSSESEDNIPLATSKEMDYLVDELSENALVHEDRKFVIKKAAAGQSLMFGHFNREQVTSRVSNKVMLPTLKGRKLSLFQDSFLLEAHDLKHLKGLKKCDTSFFFASEAEELLTTSDNPELAVQWNTTQGSTKHSTSNVWVLTCLYRPARNILFVYVADNSDVFPHKAYFDDDGYELSTQRWQWQRYSGSLFNIQSRLQELRKLSEQMRPEFGPTPLPTCSAK
ncbi:uncharacterized protein LOC111345793, partial [Stylophora pistillata]|uniref:uncharacterized protein LOC111345793 n=1 Tax=Stylophora pistillata TaxID=50429 RepID=UPI000C0460D1